MTRRSLLSTTWLVLVGLGVSEFSEPSWSLWKKGLILKDDYCNSTHAVPYSDQVSWFYTYNQRIVEPSLLSWANENSIEFVPMIGWKFVHLPDGTKCYFHKAPMCSVDDIAGLLNLTRGDMTVPPQYLISFNEPYTDDNKMTGSEIADYWRKFVMPAARQAGLRIVTATATENNVDILAFQLKRCWDHRASDEPCDVELIHAFNMHNYNCKQSFWESHYSSSGTFRKALKAAMKDYGGRSDWDDYINARKYWVTETNCNWDGDEPGSETQCRRVTGQVSSHGQGSIRTMNNIGVIERYAWWNTFNPNPDGRAKTKNARLVDAAGALLPVGKAYLNSWSSDCTSDSVEEPIVHV